MKKTFIKLLCLPISVIILLTSCSSSDITNKKTKFDIAKEKHIISFSMVGGYAGNCYTFILTPDNRLLAEYKTGKTTQQAEIKLNEHQIGLMEEHINEVLALTEDDIEYYLGGFSDYWRCTISYNDVKASFDYGASKSTTVNILLEQIIGCVDSEKALETKDTLQPITSLFREYISYYGNSEEDEE